MPDLDDADEVTRLLEGMAAGDQAARDRAFAATYAELRRIASAHMRRQRGGHTLQPTALVNEAFVKLVRAPSEGWSGRGHFYAVASKAMRSVLVDHARARRRLKRGVRSDKSVSSVSVEAPGGPFDAVDLDEALRALAAQDERAAAVVEMHCFGGRTIPEVAQALGISRATAERDWSVAKAWLRRALS